MANGTILMAFDLGFAVGSMALGAVSMVTGLRFMYLACAVVTLIPMGIFYINDGRCRGVKINAVKENL